MNHRNMPDLRFLSQATLAGCYVARSARALPQSQQAQASEPSEASPQLQAPGSTAPTSLHHDQPPEEDTSGRTSDQPKGRSMIEDASQGLSLQCTPEDCYVRVRLRFVPDPGTAEFGARVYDPHAEPGAADATMQPSKAGGSILAAGRFVGRLGCTGWVFLGFYVQTPFPNTPLLMQSAYVSPRFTEPFLWAGW